MKAKTKNPGADFGGVSFLVLLLLSCVLALTCSRDFSRSVGKGGNVITIGSITPTMAANTDATTVTIQGTNFAGELEVFIGSAAATDVALLSVNLLTAVVPAGIPAGVYDVTVTTSGGDTGVMTAGFTIVDPTLLGVTSITPDHGVNDVQTSVVIAGENFVAPLTVTVGATAMTAVEVADVNTVNAVVPPGITAGTYDVIVTNPDGTAATLYAAFEVIDSEAVRIDSIDPTSATNDEDTQLTLIGANFQSPPKVYLGDTELTDPSPVYQSETRVVATVPAGFTPGIYDVRIENPDLLSFTLPSAFTVLEPGDDTEDDTTDDSADDAADDTVSDDTTSDDDTEVW
jgi:hypothetical protein